MGFFNYPITGENGITSVEFKLLHPGNGWVRCLVASGNHLNFNFKPYKNEKSKSDHADCTGSNE